MMDVERVRAAINDLNTRFPRPGNLVLKLDGPFDLLKDWRGGKYPNSGLPGVYFLFDATERLLRIGKASCGSCIGGRLGAYFRYSPDRTYGAAKDDSYSEVRFIYSVGLPEDRAFEAAAVEEFLLSRFNPAPLLNSIGVRIDLPKTDN
jgi:hypothetical protein